MSLFYSRYWFRVSTGNSASFSARNFPEIFFTPEKAAGNPFSSGISGGKFSDGNPFLSDLWRGYDESLFIISLFLIYYVLYLTDTLSNLTYRESQKTWDIPISLLYIWALYSINRPRLKYLKQFSKHHNNILHICLNRRAFHNFYNVC